TSSMSEREGIAATCRLRRARAPARWRVLRAGPAPARRETRRALPLPARLPTRLRARLPVRETGRCAVRARLRAVGRALRRVLLIPRPARASPENAGDPRSRCPPWELSQPGNLIRSGRTLRRRGPRDTDAARKRACQLAVGRRLGANGGL